MLALDRELRGGSERSVWVRDRMRRGGGLNRQVEEWSGALRGGVSGVEIKNRP